MPKFGKNLRKSSLSDRFEELALCQKGGGMDSAGGGRKNTFRARLPRNLGQLASYFVGSK